MKRLTANTCLLFAAAFFGSASAAELSLPDWIRVEQQTAAGRMLRNISPPGATPGTVIASPSGDDPDYRYHWTRDSSLVMDQVLDMVTRAEGPRRADLFRMLRDFVLLSRRQQLAPS